MLNSSTQKLMLFMKKVLIVMTGFIILFLPLEKGVAENNIPLEVKSVDETLKIYSIPQKIKLHISLMKTYAKSQKWGQVLKHLKDIYYLCPDLKNLEVISSTEEDYSNSIFIPPKFIKEIQQLGIKNVNTEKEFLTFLELFIPLCKNTCHFEDQNQPDDEMFEEIK